MSYATGATGAAGRGSSLSTGLGYSPKPNPWAPIDALQRAGIADSISRTCVACPARGVRHDLSEADVR